jgi:hypothetical protein
MSTTGSYCRYCGTRNELSSKFCSNCGRATALAAEGEKNRAEQEAPILPKDDNSKEKKEKGDNKEKLPEKKENVVKYLKPTADASPPSGQSMPHGMNFSYRGGSNKNQIKNAGKALLGFGIFLIIISMLVTAFGGGIDPMDTEAFIQATETSTQIFVVGFIFLMIGLGVYALGVRRG